MNAQIATNTLVSKFATTLKDCIIASALMDMSSTVTDTLAQVRN